MYTTIKFKYVNLFFEFYISKKKNILKEKERNGHTTQKIEASTCEHSHNKTHTKPQI